MPLPCPDDTCLLYLVRHGATANNLARPPVLQGRGVNLGLSPEGLRQAQKTAEFLRDRPLAAAYSSVLARAVETALIIAAPHGLEVKQLEAITEVDVGQWEGRRWTEIAQTDADAYRRFMEDAGAHGYLGGETLAQVEARVTPALREVMASHLGQRVLVVAHNVVNRAFLASLLQLPLSRARILRQDNGCVNVIRYRDGEVEVVTMNEIFHLG
jgi:broad specificity phosphatase PhoE